MNKLIEANLLYPNAIPIKGFLVERYNKCLELFGIKPTKLQDFTIDAKGWSPEIAQEKNNEYYLNNGDANPYAIIISPLQKDKKVFNPFYSYESQIMQDIFTKYEAEIKDITKESALCVAFNKKLDVFYDSFDLLKYDSISVEFYLINNIKEIKEEQLQLESKFLQNNNFVDEKLHQKILSSVRKYGDLRKRNLDLEPITFNVSSFYTKAFGGVFVFKNFVQEMLVYENKQTYHNAIKNENYQGLIFFNEDMLLLEKLNDYIVIELNSNKLLQSERYQRIKNHIFAQLFSKTEHPMEQILDSKLLFKRYLNNLDLEGKKRVMAVERYAEILKENPKAKIEDYVPSDIIKALYQPHSSLIEDTNLVWKLLQKTTQKDPFYMYVYAKNTFYKAFSNYNESYQNWIVKYIKKHLKTI